MFNISSYCNISVMKVEKYSSVIYIKLINSFRVTSIAGAEAKRKTAIKGIVWYIRGHYLHLEYYTF